MSKRPLLVGGLLAAFVALPAAARAQQSPPDPPFTCAGKVGVISTGQTAGQWVRALVRLGVEVDSAAVVALPEASAPALRNTREAERTVAREYPPELAGRSLSGQVTLLVLVDEDGSVARAFRLPRASSLAPEDQQAFDEAAQRAVRRLRFRPARHLGCVLPAWTNVPVEFKPAPSR